MSLEKTLSLIEKNDFKNARKIMEQDARDLLPKQIAEFIRKAFAYLPFSSNSSYNANLVEFYYTTLKKMTIIHSHSKEKKYSA